jgi:hypothetical protein
MYVMQDPNTASLEQEILKQINRNGKCKETKEIVKLIDREKSGETDKQ